MKSSTLNSSEQLNSFSDTFSIYSLMRSSEKTNQTIQNPSELPENKEIMAEQLQNNHSELFDYPNLREKTGVKWCRDRLPALLAGSWTEKELFNPKWPLGIALLVVWNRPGLEVKMVDGCVRFNWTNATGGRVEQVGRPEVMTRRWAHETA